MNTHLKNRIINPDKIFCKSEQRFIDFKKTEGKTLLNPRWFYFKEKMPNGKQVKYHPDFYCPEEDMYYEVVGTYSAYYQNKHKYKLMEKNYPDINFKTVSPDGETFFNFLKIRSPKTKIITTKEIKELRKALHLTQFQLATKLGIAISTVYFWEKGTCKPSGLALQKLTKLQKTI